MREKRKRETREGEKKKRNERGGKEKEKRVSQRLFNSLKSPNT